MRPAPPLRRRARGNYVLLLAASLMAVLGFGALSIDVGWMLLARGQAQDVADAASQAGMIVLRQTASQPLAEDAIRQVVGRNQVAGVVPHVEAITWGTWDDSLANPVFVPGGARPNAVRVTVSRTGDHAVPLMLSRIWGKTSFSTRGQAVSATRSIQLVVVLDITGSWGESDFGSAREAVLQAVDMIAGTATDADEIGMTIFTNRYAWAYTPFTNISIPANALAVRQSWERLNIASKGGTDANHRDGVACVLKPLAERNDFTNPDGGCYPDMPREYTDEPGTDHSTGILLAQQLYEEAAGGANYRAMIVLTDGRPNGLGGTSGQLRAAEGYVEARWREYQGPVPRSQDDIRDASILASAQLWADLDVHTWVVSLVEHDDFMPAMVRGDGYYTRTDSADELAGIFRQIISELPLAIVE